LEGGVGHFVHRDATLRGTASVSGAPRLEELPRDLLRNFDDEHFPLLAGRLERRVSTATEDVGYVVSLLNKGLAITPLAATDGLEINLYCRIELEELAITNIAIDIYRLDIHKYQMCSVHRLAKDTSMLISGWQ
jgi:hypothetical protein